MIICRVFPRECPPPFFFPPSYEAEVQLGGCGWAFWFWVFFGGLGGTRFCFHVFLLSLYGGSVF